MEVWLLSQAPQELEGCLESGCSPCGPSCTCLLGHRRFEGGGPSLPSTCCVLSEAADTHLSLPVTSLSGPCFLFLELWS